MVAALLEYIDQSSGVSRLAVQFATKLKNGTGTLTAQINGESQDFPLSMYTKPRATQAGNKPAPGAKPVPPGSDSDWFTISYDPIVAGCKARIAHRERCEDIAKKGKNLIIVANVNSTLHFRIFDADWQNGGRYGRKAAED